jgi:hypothetical protein
MEILEGIKKWWKGEGADRAQKRVLYADDAKPLTAKLSMNLIDANRMTGAPHPPDLAPSDFFLFGDAKRELSGCSFDDADDLLTAVQEPLDGFEQSTSISVFDEWVKRLEQCIETQGE